MINISLTIVFIAAIEIITIVVRFLFNISAKVRYEKILRKFGFKYLIHIHHMYFGIILAIYWIELGIALIISDLLHHFVVLKLVEGDSEFRFIHRI